MFFINKGIIFFDEGYMLHFAERIVQGQIPYYDFFIQYTPGFFYVLALFFKLFGTTILVGRIVTIIIALAILLMTLFLLDEIRSDSLKFKIAATITMAAFGFPLMNIPADVWPCILLVVGIMFIFIKWSKASVNEWKYAMILGILLALMLFVKQNLGFAFIITSTLLILFSERKSYAKKIKNIALMDSIFVLLSIPWVYYFFIRNHFLSAFLTFNKNFVNVYPFSYPEITKVLEPLGLFKLLPYYLPIFFLFLLCYLYLFKKVEKNYIFTALLPLVGFAFTVVPASDLLHVYPFLGLTLVMFLIILGKAKLRFKKVYFVLIALTILSGFYLTFFREQYRYGLPYRVDTTSINLPKTEGIVIDPLGAKQYTLLDGYINKHTAKDSYILVYPFSPMFYFMFDRKNPTRFANLLPLYLTKTEEEEVIESIKEKKVSIVLIMGNFKFNTPISQWIQKNTVQTGLYDGVFIRTVKNNK